MNNADIYKGKTVVRHRVYMRDWFYNSGIAGFLDVVTDDQPLDTISDLDIHENYLEFSNVVLTDFEEKFRRKAFLYFFNLSAVLFKVESNIKELIEILDDEKKRKELKLKKYNDDLNKYPNTKFFHVFFPHIENIANGDNFLKELQTIRDVLRGYHSREKQIYAELEKKTGGKEYIRNFNKRSFKGISADNNISSYVQDINKINYQKVPKPNETCLSCQMRKSSEEFNNAISNIIGFNKDNSNWTWGFKSSNTKVCSVCALINSCSIFAFGYVLKRVDKNWLNFFYAVNRNESITAFYKSVMLFKNEIHKDGENLFYKLIRQTVRDIEAQKMKTIRENINFIEIVDNPILGGQSSRGYVVYNYNIDPPIAEYLSPFFNPDEKWGIPAGYYIFNKEYRNLTEELLKLTILKTLNYKRLDYYWRIYLSKSKNKKLPMWVITQYILNYIKHMKGRHMKGNDQSIRRGFSSGARLREKLLRGQKANQINGLLYSFMNDLKITDREKFLDKYLRSMMAHQLPSYFGKAEMSDTDSFLQFGYSFINGLMNQGKSEKDENNQTNTGA